MDQLNQLLQISIKNKLFLFLIFFILTPFGGFALNMQIQTEPEKIYQADVFIITLSSDIPIKKITGEFRNKKISFFQNNKKYKSLVGIDLRCPAATYKLEVEVLAENEQSMSFNLNIPVLKKDYGIEKLTLPPEYFIFDEKTLERILKEKTEVLSLFKKITAEPFFEGNFTSPVSVKNSKKNFGKRRIINGEERNPHSGLDFRGKIGTELKATNNGKVAFVCEHFFAGNSVFIDHGLGLYSMYFHLSKVLVKEGDMVKKGQVVGLAGKSGRSTGPHLHFGFNLNGARIDPEIIFGLKNLRNPTSTSVQ